MKFIRSGLLELASIGGTLPQPDDDMPPPKFMPEASRTSSYWVKRLFPRTMMTEWVGVTVTEYKCNTPPTVVITCDQEKTGIRPGTYSMEEAQALGLISPHMPMQPAPETTQPIMKPDVLASISCSELFQ